MKIFRKIVSIFWAVAFLLSGFGFTIGKMVCLKSGKTFISLSVAKDCCSEKKQKQHSKQYEINKGGCCDVTNTSLQLKDFHPSKINKAEAVSFSLLNNNIPSELTQENRINTTNKLFFCDLPPPLYGKSLLNLFSILII